MLQNGIQDWSRHWSFRCFSAALLFLLGVGLFSQSHAQIAGGFQRAEFEAVVTSLRSQKMEAGRTYRFRLDRNLSAKTLRPLTQNLRRGEGRGLVWAEVTKTGVLTVVIETQDNGHAGEQGYLFSDAAVQTSDIYELGREWIVLHQVSIHWWRVLYNLG